MDQPRWFQQLKWCGGINIAMLNENRKQIPILTGRYVFTIEAWIDHFETWSKQLAKRVAAGQDVKVELEAGARMLEEAASRAGRAQGADSADGQVAGATRSSNDAPCAKLKMH